MGNGVGTLRALTLTRNFSCASNVLNPVGAQGRGSTAFICAAEGRSTIVGPGLRSQGG